MCGKGGGVGIVFLCGREGEGCMCPWVCGCHIVSVFNLLNLI